MPTIHINTSQLSRTQFLIPGSTGWLDGAASPAVDLPAGVYHFQQYSGAYADFTFEVKADGTVDYGDAFAGFLSGKGTSTLVISGFTIHLDATALSHSLLPMVTGVFLDPTSTHDLRLVPASSYMFQPGSGVVASFVLKVDLAGNASVDPQYAGFASASGNTVTIKGYKVRIDARALSHDLLPISLGGYTGGFLPRATVNELTLIPAAGYGFQPGSGIVANLQFTLDVSGNVSIGAPFAGFASATGNTLTIRGCTVTIDGRALSHDLLPISLAGYTGGFLSRSSTHQLTLIPASGYTFQPGSGIVADMAFTVGADGTFSYPATCGGFLGGQGTSTLVVRGFPIVVDATAADSDLVSLVNVPVTIEAHRYVLAVLVPCHGYGLRTANGIFAHGFNVERDGTITFDPAVAGKLAVSTTLRLEIRGATPF